MTTSNQVKEKALFVDDDPFLIQGLQRLLRPLRNDWDMTFVGSGQEALKLMLREPFSVLVTDMRMPEMNGAELLQEVMKLRPGTMRIILSGQAELDATLQSVCNAHQYLSKPCDGNRLKSLLSNKNRLQGLINNQELQNFIAHITHIPSQTESYNTLIAEIHGENPSLPKLAHCISNDIGMSVRILQIANSACFNPKTEIICPFQAVTILGVDLLKALVDVSVIFKPCSATYNDIETGKSSATLNALNRHSVSVANLARRIALIERGSSRDATLCSTTGLMHDVGKIILMLFNPTEYTNLLLEGIDNDLVHADKIEAELQLFGATHSEVGAYLLGLWGLPDQIVEAAANHSLKDIKDVGNFSVISALQVANTLDPLVPPTSFDYLENEKDLQHYRKLLEEKWPTIQKGSHGSLPS